MYSSPDLHQWSFGRWRTHTHTKREREKRGESDSKRELHWHSVISFPCSQNFLPKSLGDFSWILWEFSRRSTCLRMSRLLHGDTSGSRWSPFRAQILLYCRQSWSLCHWRVQHKDQHIHSTNQCKSTVQLLWLCWYCCYLWSCNMLMLPLQLYLLLLAIPADFSWQGVADYGAYSYYASKSFWDEPNNRRVVWGWINENDNSTSFVSQLNCEKFFFWKIAHFYSKWQTSHSCFLV